MFKRKNLRYYLHRISSKHEKPCVDYYKVIKLNVFIRKTPNGAMYETFKYKTLIAGNPNEESLSPFIWEIGG